MPQKEIMLKEKIDEINKNAGRVLNLNELISELNGEKLYENKNHGIDDYCFVHVTNFAPSEDKIKIRADNEDYVKKDMTKKENLLYYSARRTTHFAVNGKVSNVDFSTWDKEKYAVIIPGRNFCNNNSKTIVSVRPEDTYIDGSANISEGIILCPNSEYLRVSQQNPNVAVIPVNGEYVVDTSNNINYVDDVLKILPVMKREVGEHGWMSRGGYEDELETFQEGINLWKIVEKETR